MPHDLRFRKENLQIPEKINESRFLFSGHGVARLALLIQTTLIANADTRKFFDKYYKGREKAVALKIKECKEYKEAINPESLIPNFKVPQSFIYIEDKITPQIE